MAAVPRHSDPGQSTDALRLVRAKQAIGSLLDRLDAGDDGKFRNRRGDPRTPFRKLDVAVRVIHPGGSSANKLVATRNLSGSGMAFLYNSFLHTGTRVEVTLQRRLGGDDVLKGKVVFCAHVGGVFHQVGVRFDGKIFPSLYMEPTPSAKSLTIGGDDSSPTGKLLYIDECEADRATVTRILEATKITLRTAPDEAAAVALARVAPFDLVVCAPGPSASGESIFGALRGAGYAGPICTVASPVEQTTSDATAKPPAEGLSKPYDPERLIAALGKLLRRVRSGDEIVSAFADKLDMRVLLERYVDSVHQMVTEIQQASQQNQLDRLRQICASIKGSGVNYGFACLSEAAKDAIRLLDTTKSIEASTAQLVRLAELCRRVVLHK